MAGKPVAIVNGVKIYSALSTDPRPGLGEIDIGSEIWETDPPYNKRRFNGSLWPIYSTTAANGSEAGPVQLVGGKLNTYHDAATVDGDSASFSVSAAPSWQAWMTAAAETATVTIYVSNDGTHWTSVGTISLDTSAGWTTSADDDVEELIPDKFGSWKYSKVTISSKSAGVAEITVVGG